MIQVISSGVAGLVLGLALATLDGLQRAMMVTLAIGVAVLAGLWNVYRNRSQAAPPSTLSGTPSPFVARVAAATRPERDAAQLQREREHRAKLERWDTLRTMVEGAPVHGLGRRAWAGKRTRSGTRISQGTWRWAFDTLRAANAVRQDGQGWKLAGEPAAVLHHFGLAASTEGRLFIRSTPPPDAQNLVRV